MKITLDTVDNILKAKIEVDNEQTKQIIEKNLDNVEIKKEHFLMIDSTDHDFNKFLNEFKQFLIQLKPKILK